MCLDFSKFLSDFRVACPGIQHSVHDQKEDVHYIFSIDENSGQTANHTTEMHACLMFLAVNVF